MSELTIIRMSAICYLAIAFVAIPTGSLMAQGKAGQLGANITGNLPSVQVPGQGIGQSKSGHFNTANDGMGNGSEGSGIGAHGAFQGNYAIPLSEQMSLQFNGVLDLEEQVGADTNGDLTGRIGIGRKF